MLSMLPIGRGARKKRDAVLEEVEEEKTTGVRFANSSPTVVPVTPYENVYGVPPDKFEFDRQGRMQPVEGVANLNAYTPSQKGQRVLVVQGTPSSTTSSSLDPSPVGFGPLGANLSIEKNLASATPRSGAAPAVLFRTASNPTTPAAVTGASHFVMMTGPSATAPSSPTAVAAVPATRVAAGQPVFIQQRPAQAQQVPTPVKIVSGAGTARPVTVVQKLAASPQQVSPQGSHNSPLAAMQTSPPQFSPPQKVVVVRSQVQAPQARLVQQVSSPPRVVQFPPPTQPQTQPQVQP